MKPVAVFYVSTVIISIVPNHQLDTEKLAFDDFCCPILYLVALYEIIDLSSKTSHFPHKSLILASSISMCLFSFSSGKLQAFFNGNSLLSRQ